MSNFRKAQVTFGFGDEGLDCIIWDESTWNGWAQPAFTKEQGLKVAEEYVRIHVEAGIDAKAGFDSETNNFFFGNDQIDDYFEPAPFTFKSNGVTYYSIGSASWTWEETE